MNAAAPSAKARRSLRTTLRRWHRWVSWAALLLLGWVTATGTVLAIEFYIGSPPREAKAARPGAPIQRDIGPVASRAVAAVAATADGAHATMLQVDLASNAPVVVAVMTPDTRTDWLVETRARDVPSIRKSGPAQASGGISPEAIALHNLLIALHNGSIVGLPGRLVDVLAGLSFTFLSLSGAWLYLDMHRQRRRAGRGARPFWSR